MRIRPEADVESRLSISPAERTAIGDCRMDSSCGVGHAPPAGNVDASICSTLFLVGHTAGRGASKGEARRPQPSASARRSQCTHPARRDVMTRLTPSALSSETEGAAAADVECWHEVHRLPFNSDSPTWIQERLARPAAEERLTRLVKTLEAEVIPRLVEAHRAMPVIDAVPAACACPPPTAAEVEAFVQLVLRREDLPISACIGALRDKGMSVEVLYLDLLAPAANHLGYLWVEDLCDFTDVTIALGRLQHLLQELSPAFGNEVEFPANARRALLVPAPGEQHTFGLSMVAEFFMHAGWEVAGSQGAYRDEAVDMVRREWFDVIGFSVGSDARLEWLTSCIASVRQMSRNKNIGVLVGGPVFALNPDYVALVGADATTSDGKQAPIAAEGLIAGRVKSR
jgi:methanogenic corrinoid protein MtbC1